MTLTIILALLALLFIIAARKANTYVVERNALITATPKALFPQLSELKSVGEVVAMGGKIS